MKIGFGTYPLTGDTCKQAVRDAYEVGYRMFDTATFYNNFEPIGEALKNAPRSEIFVISKAWHDKHKPEDLQDDLHQALQALGMDYLDAYLLHWPNSGVSIFDALRSLQEMKAESKIKHIGLSNVTVNHLKRALEVGVPIDWVQIEMNPAFFDAEVVEFCHQHKIGVQAWCPLGRGKVLEDAYLHELGQKYGKTPFQIALRWIVQHDCVPLPGSTNPEHMRANFSVLDFALTDDEMQTIDTQAKKGERTRITLDKGLGFADEFDYTYEQCWPN